jgi:hypothetical protein
LVGWVGYVVGDATPPLGIKGKSDTFCLILLYQKGTKGTRNGNALMLIQAIHNLIPQKRQHEPTLPGYQEAAGECNANCFVRRPAQNDYGQDRIDSAQRLSSGRYGP